MRKQKRVPQTVYSAQLYIYTLTKVLATIDDQFPPKIFYTEEASSTGEAERGQVTKTGTTVVVIVEQNRELNTQYMTKLCSSVDRIVFCYRKQKEGESCRCHGSPLDRLILKSRSQVKVRISRPSMPLCVGRLISLAHVCFIDS